MSNQDEVKQPYLYFTNKQKIPKIGDWLGARDGARTRDLLLGKETFYQLNYSRRSLPAIMRSFGRVPKVGVEPTSQVFQTSAVTTLATSACLAKALASADLK